MWFIFFTRPHEASFSQLSDYFLEWRYSLANLRIGAESDGIADVSSSQLGSKGELCFGVECRGKWEDALWRKESRMYL
jgi:hypothetical protein